MEKATSSRPSLEKKKRWPPSKLALPNKAGKLLHLRNTILPARRKTIAGQIIKSPLHDLTARGFLFISPKVGKVRKSGSQKSSSFYSSDFPTSGLSDSLDKAQMVVFLSEYRRVVGAQPVFEHRGVYVFEIDFML